MVRSEIGRYRQQLIVSIISFAGLVLITLAGFYIQNTIILHKPTTVQSPTVYWSSVNLEDNLEDTILSDDNCYSSEKVFLGCIKAIESVSVHFQILPHPDGRFKIMSAADFQEIKNEKKQMLIWSKYFNQKKEKVKFSLAHSWLTMKEKLFQDKYKSFLVGTALNGYLSIVEDPHTYLAPQQWFMDRIATEEQNLNTFGFSLERNEKGYVVTRSQIREVQEGDLILKFNHKSLNSLFPFEVQDLIGQSLDQMVPISFIRDGQKISMTLSSRVFDISSVEGRLSEKNNSMGYIKIRRFSRGTCQSVKEVIQKFQSKTKLEGLVLDLRNNPGGIIAEAGCTAGLFLGPHKLVYSLKTLSEKFELNPNITESYHTQDKEYFKDKLMVLVNNETASAAEILAGSLKDYQRARLVGTRTFGKGSYQVGQAWSQNSQLIFFKTTGFYFLPMGSSPQIVGVQPEVQYLTKRELLQKNRGAFEQGEGQYWSAINIHDRVLPDRFMNLMSSIQEASNLNANLNPIPVLYAGEKNVGFGSCQSEYFNSQDDNLEMQAEAAEKLFQCLKFSKLEGGAL